jgi:hypothetical protein
MPFGNTFGNIRNANDSLGTVLRTSVCGVRRRARRHIVGTPVLAPNHATGHRSPCHHHRAPTPPKAGHVLRMCVGVGGVRDAAPRAGRRQPWPLRWKTSTMRPCNLSEIGQLPPMHHPQGWEPPVRRRRPPGRSVARNMYGSGVLAGGRFSHRHRSDWAPEAATARYSRSLSM